MTDHLKGIINEEHSKDIRKFFKNEFGHQPDFVVSAPGRVNIIGEHIDYSGYSVLPIAIAQCIEVAVSVNSTNIVHITNFDKEHYDNYTCKVENIGAISKPPAWFDYVLCGLHGVQQELGPLPGMSLMVGGTVPPSAGLSSSSALVCGAALAATEAVRNKNPEKSSSLVDASGHIDMKSLAQICADSERFVGTQGGGMDQAACLLSKEGFCQHISFNPLRCENVSLPRGFQFIVANSMVKADKAATVHFNARVMECRLSCYVIAKAEGLEWTDVKTLSVLQEKLGASYDDMIEKVRASLHDGDYSIAEIADLLNVDKEILVKKHLSENTQHVTQFLLKPRALHVYEEAKRVEDFIKTCKAWEAKEESATDAERGTVLKQLGVLLTASHTSLRSLYECSHPLLDELVEKSIEVNIR